MERALNGEVAASVMEKLNVLAGKLWLGGTTRLERFIEQLRLAKIFPKRGHLRLLLQSTTRNTSSNVAEQLFRSCIGRVQTDRNRRGKCSDAPVRKLH